MKRFLLTTVIALMITNVWAQNNPALNMELRSNVQYNNALNDIWGWTNEDTGEEYAIVGLQTGVSIVSLADLDNAEELHFISGPTSTWRDIKSWKDHVYVSNETSGGVLVIDMSGLPEEISFTRWEPNIPELGGQLTSIHNLFVDEKGILQIAGASINGGGIIYADVDTDPANPVHIGQGPATYAHDVFTRGDTMYASEIYQGNMAIYDISDKQNAVFLAAQQTPANFTHNIWLSDDSKTAFTTDETGDAPVGAFDISDLDDIELIDAYRPIGSLGTGTVPHNVHVWNDYLLISYYTDGGRIVDASVPDNLIEVGSFDSFLGGNGGFSGAWGLYPFLPSRTVLVSDIGNGLYVLTPTFVRAARLQGVVTDAVSGENIISADVTMATEEPNLGSTDNMGVYKTGLATAGTYDVTFSKVGYETKTVSAEITNGVITTLDVQLQPLNMYTISGQAIRTEDMRPVPNAVVVLTNEQITYETTSDINGDFVISVLEGDYDIFGGAWGFKQIQTSATISGSADLLIELERGFEDDFVLDLGWESTSSASATSGYWERGIPNGTQFNGLFANPGMDIQDDLGDACYVTGNGGGGAGSDDVDDGTVTLTSPVMNLSQYENPVLSYRAWFFNRGGNGTPNDDLVVRINNGTEEVALESIATSRSTWLPTSSFILADWIDITSTMTISFTTGDQAASGHLVEAAIDQFLVIDDVASGINQIASEKVNLAAFPNPFTNAINLTFSLENLTTDANLKVYNSIGQPIETIALDRYQTTVALGQSYPKGLYFISIETANEVSQAIRVMKQ